MMTNGFGQSINDFLAALPVKEQQPSLFSAQQKKQSEENKARLKADYFAARELAVTYIGIGQKFSGAVYRKLLAKEVQPQMAQYVVGRLIKDGYINDEHLVQARLKNRRCREYESISFAKRRFLQQGCSVKAYLNAVRQLQLDDRILCAAFVAEKHGRSLTEIYEELPSLSVQQLFHEKSVQKIARQTMSRGFSSNLVRSCIVEYLSHLSEGAGYSLP